MSMDDIRNLPVRELADKNCILFMWLTFPTLCEAFSVIDAWGFTYKTVAFAWVKQNKKTSSLFWGMGYWTRAKAMRKPQYYQKVINFLSQLIFV